AADGTGLPEGTVFPLQPVTSLGRAPTNTVALPDSYASGEHALLSLRGNQWWLEDLGSRNGTFLNGVLITEPVVASAGDIISIGRVQLKVELE
ncbi:MAG: FHA domain-containing protein, partial [Chloroflexota bacterium]